MKTEEERKERTALLALPLVVKALEDALTNGVAHAQGCLVGTTHGCNCDMIGIRKRGWEAVRDAKEVMRG